METDPVKQKILTIVAEKTGYPIDMLDLDLDLEADLGVDTVKQAEVFATVRETYGIARTTNSSCATSPPWPMLFGLCMSGGLILPCRAALACG